MSVSSSVIAKPVSNQFFDRLPDAVTRSVFEFLKGANGIPALGNYDQAIIATSAVCRNWRANLTLEQERQEASTRLRSRINFVIRNYPRAMIELFRRCHSSVSRLPVLDFGDRMGITDYIDMLHPADMTHPVMRFTDRFNRPGIAFHVEGHADGNFGYHRVPREIRDISGVLAVFKRYPDRNSWRIGMGGDLNEAMFLLHIVRHHQNGHVGLQTMECPTCPSGLRSGDAISYPTLYNLLTGNDPLFRIAQGYVPPENPEPMHHQIPATNRSGFSVRTIMVTSFAALAIAYLMNYYLASEKALPSQLVLE